MGLRFEQKSKGGVLAGVQEVSQVGSTEKTEAAGENLDGGSSKTEPVCRMEPLK